MAKNVKKRRLPGIARFFIVLLIIVIAIPVAAVGLIYALFYDGASITYEYADDFDAGKRIQQRLVESLDDTKTSGKIDFALNEDDLNNILHYTLESAIPAQAKSFLKGYKIDIDGENVSFFVSAAAFGVFQTKVELKTKAKYVDPDENNGTANDAYFSFAIENAKLGRIDAQPIVKANIKSFVKDEDIEKPLADAGLHIDVDLANLSLTYPISTLLDDLGQILKENAGEGENLALFTSLLSDIVDNDLLKINFGANEAIGAGFDLTKFHTNATLLPSAKDAILADIDYAACASYAEYLLDQGYIEQDAEYFSGFMTFLVRGYLRDDGDLADEDACAALDKLVQAKGDSFLSDKGEAGNAAFSSGIASIQHYKPSWYDSIYDPNHDGIDEDSNQNPVNIAAGFTEKLNDALANPLDSDKQTALTTYLTTHGNQLVSISDETFTTRFRASALHGQCFPFAAEEEDGYHFAYIAVNDFYAKVLNNTLLITISLSINGYDVYAIIEAQQSAEPSPNKNEFYLDVKNIYLGELQMSQDFVETIFNRVAEAMAGSDGISDYLSLDVANKRLILNLQQIMVAKIEDSIGSLPDLVKNSLMEKLAILDTEMSLENDAADHPIDHSGTINFAIE